MTIPITPSRARGLLALGIALAAPAAFASHLQGDTLAKVANYLAIFVIVVVPFVVIALFWMVHVLPEKIAHKRRHPQTEAIQVLCLLSLVFGGMLWPIAWLWAYSKPVLYKMAYGTDKADAHDDAGGTDPGPGTRTDLHEDLVRVRSELDRLVARADAPAELAAIRERLAALEPRVPVVAEEAR